MGDWDALEDDKRAGGIKGFLDEESWWKKGGSCTITKRMILCLSDLERASLLADDEVRKLVEKAMDEEKVKWMRRDAVAVPEILAKSGKVVRKRTLRPYWMRTIESIDPSQVGTKRLVGDWVADPAGQCDDGELIVVGLRYPEKRYALCRAKGKAVGLKLFESLRPDIEMDGVELVGEWSGFGSLLGEAERLLSTDPGG